MWLSKAFHSASHSILLKKCASPNIDLLWLNSYLRNRTQSVKPCTMISSRPPASTPPHAPPPPLAEQNYFADMSDLRVWRCWTENLTLNGINSLRKFGVIVLQRQHENIQCVWLVCLNWNQTNIGKSHSSLPKYDVNDALAKLQDIKHTRHVYPLTLPYRMTNTCSQKSQWALPNSCLPSGMLQEIHHELV